MGTNDIATSQMMKAGANRGATGENAICDCVGQVDVILGSLSILISHSMMGEITPAMAVAVGASEAAKILLPIVSEPVAVVGAIGAPCPGWWSAWSATISQPTLRMEDTNYRLGVSPLPACALIRPVESCGLARSHE